jgi:hypothetical protein
VGAVGVSPEELEAVATRAHRAYGKWLNLDGGMAACEAAGVCINDVPRLVKALREANANLDHIRRAVAALAGADPETWPDHGNAPLAIAAWLEQLRISMEENAALLDAIPTFPARFFPSRAEARQVESMQELLSQAEGWGAGWVEDANGKTWSVMPSRYEVRPAQAARTAGGLMLLFEDSGASARRYKEEAFCEP